MSAQSDSAALEATANAARAQGLYSERAEALFRERFTAGAVTADVWLVAAFLARVPTATEELAAAVERALDQLRGRGLQPADREELRSRVMEELLVGEAPGIRAYRGRGPLAGFLRVVAVRQLSAMRGPAAHVQVDEEELLLRGIEAPASSPDAEALRARLRRKLRPLLQSAFAALPPRERLLLRQHYLDGLSLEALARAHGGHRATVARWLEGARAAYLERVRDTVSVQLGVPRLEADSVVRSVQSQIDLSFTLATSAS